MRHFRTLLLICIVVGACKTVDALFGRSAPIVQSSLTQSCALELHTVAPNCVTSMFSDVQTLKAEMEMVKNKDLLLKSDLEAEDKTVSELRKEVGKTETIFVTLSQTTNIRLFQTERVGRRQFQIQ